MSDDFTEKLAPGAFRNSIGKEVPFKINGGRVIGRARVLDEDGLIEFTFTDPEAIKLIRSITAPPPDRPDSGYDLKRRYDKETHDRTES